MVRVKICGITSVENAETALECGADAIGLVFAKSPRRVSVRQARKITAAVGPWMTTVGVFVNEKLGRVLRIAKACRLSAIQLHGDEPPSYIKRLGGHRVIKAVRVARSSDLEGAPDWGADALLFDTKVEGSFGGTGKSFDWKILKSRKIRKPFIVSGGLNPKNVREAVRVLSPYGVDVSSGVEKAPGKKDPALVREFIRNAKEA
jgi:phosphoribosylanthranilate isomerase